MNVIRLVGIAALLAASQARAGGMDDTIAMCNSCHGDDGVSQWTDVPTIAGIDVFVHSDALYVYQDAARPCGESEIRQGPRAGETATMCEAVDGLGEAQIEAIAEHYAALPFVPAKQPFDADLAAAGAAIHDSECSRCHSDGGSDPSDEASILAGQWMGYLESTFAQYAAGEREQPEKMKAKMDALSDEQVTALLHYYASQQ